MVLSQGRPAPGWSCSILYSGPCRGHNARLRKRIAKLRQPLTRSSVRCFGCTCSAQDFHISEGNSIGWVLTENGFELFQSFGVFAELDQGGAEIQARFGQPRHDLHGSVEFLHRISRSPRTRKMQTIKKTGLDHLRRQLRRFGILAAGFVVTTGPLESLSSIEP